MTGRAVSGPAAPDDQGAVTAETAVVLPVLALVLVLVLWSVSVFSSQLRCVDAARVAARALARGDSAALALAAARDAAPRGAGVQAAREGDLVAVDVEVTEPLPGPWSGRGPSVTVRARAVAVAEDP